MLIDSHCHLNYPGIVEDQAGVIDRARAAGVTGMLGISTKRHEWADVIAIAEVHPDIWASVGIHPHEADAHPDIDTDDLVAAARHPRVVAIGETGLDYYSDKSDRERQRSSFRSHIAASRETQLPLIVHTRDAEADTHEMLADEMGKGAFPGVIHCFTASQDFANKALALGFYISLSGIEGRPACGSQRATGADASHPDGGNLGDAQPGSRNNDIQWLGCNGCHQLPNLAEVANPGREQAVCAGIGIGPQAHDDLAKTFFAAQHTFGAPDQNCPSP